jgi:hypothetical protein
MRWEGAISATCDCDESEMLELPRLSLCLPTADRHTHCRTGHPLHQRLSNT